MDDLSYLWVSKFASGSNSGKTNAAGLIWPIEVADVRFGGKFDRGGWLGVGRVGIVFFFIGLLF